MTGIKHTIDENAKHIFPAFWIISIYVPLNGLIELTGNIVPFTT